MRRARAYEELTDSENEPIMGTLKSATWRGMSVELVADKWYALDLEVDHTFEPSKALADSCATCGHEAENHLSELPSPLGSLIHEARWSSGSIGGEHRRDVKEALIGAPTVATGLSVGAQAHGEGGNEDTKKRGL